MLLNFAIWQDTVVSIDSEAGDGQALTVATLWAHNVPGATRLPKPASWGNDDQLFGPSIQQSDINPSRLDQAAREAAYAYCKSIGFEVVLFALRPSEAILPYLDVLCLFNGNYSRDFARLINDLRWDLNLRLGLAACRDIASLHAVTVANGYRITIDELKGAADQFYVTMKVLQVSQRGRVLALPRYSEPEMDLTSGFIKDAVVALSVVLFGPCVAAVNPGGLEAAVLVDPIPPAIGPA